MNLLHLHILLVMICCSSVLSLSFLEYTDAKNIRSVGSLEDDIHVVVVIVDIDLLLIADLFFCVVMMFL